MKGKRVSLYLAGIAFCEALSLLAGCTFINPPNGGTDQTCGTQVGDPNEVLAGCVNDQDGNPAVAATVLVYPSNSGALAKPSVLPSTLSSTDSAGNPIAADLPDSIVVQTNNYGRYSITRKLPARSYDILIQSSSDAHQPDGSPRPMSASLKPNVSVDTGGHLMLNTLTLLPRGSIQGRVVDGFGSTIPGVICSDPGGRFVDTTDETGWFNLALPQGRYTLICSHSPQKQVRLDGIAVASNQDTRLPLVELSDGEGNIPLGILTAKYDSITGTVHLSWPKTSFNGFFWYEVRRIDTRKFPDSVSFRTTDTVYDDLVYRSRAEKNSTRLYYNVRVRTNTRLKDWATGQAIDVRPPQVVGPDIELGYADTTAGPGPLDSLIVHPDSLFTVGDTAQFLGKYQNLFRSNTKIIWVVKRAYDDTFAWIPESSETRSILKLSGTDAFRYPCLLAGKMQISLTVEDEMGTSNTVSLRFEIVKPKDP